MAAPVPGFDSADPAIPVAGQVRCAMEDFVRAAGARRSLPAVLHLGVPGGEHATLPDAPGHDAGLRVDLVVRALDGLACAAPLAWVSRSGPLAATDVDLAWLAACRHAFARHSLPLTGFYLVTRRGWADLLGDARHRWSRVRPRPQA
ncbi:hypothetical protein [Mycobacterium sp.]|uniref:hypothetical protein n=1 Tax=Mycobacterium sp. TaxID=1785 RepID=UPI003D6BF130